MKRSTHQVFTAREQAPQWADIARAIAKLTEWKAETPVTNYVESVQACDLRSATFGEAVPPADPFEGRIFDGCWDVRWVFDAGAFHASMIRDVPTGAPVPDGVTVHDVGWMERRRYYMLGTSTGNQVGNGWAFREGRFPRQQFLYPVGPGEELKDRAYVEVVEYFRPEPSSWADDEETINETLDEPMLLAHRFVRVDVGRGNGRDLNHG